jgi:tRNA A37 methylthiotransferase MiaB
VGEADLSVGDQQGTGAVAPGEVPVVVLRNRSLPETARFDRREPGPVRVALVQAPAWGALPPLGPCTLKAFLTDKGYEADCFDLNIDFYNEHLQTKKQLEVEGLSYGGPDPWGADSYGQWALNYDDAYSGTISFQDGSIYNDTPLPLTAWAQQILDTSPGVVGFTCYLTSFASSLQLAQEIRRLDPTVLIVFGGPNVAKDREGNVALQTGIPDVIVHSEGEETLLAVVQALETGGDLAEVAGIGIRVDGAPVWTEVRPLIKKIDVLPYPDFSDLDWSNYPNPYLIPIMASRGCVLNCAFCYETVYWKRFRMQSPERIVAEIEHQIALHPYKDKAAENGKHFYFMFGDSLVNGHLSGLQRLCKLLIERKVGIYWGGQARMDKRMDDEVCKLLADSGCTGLAFGLESGSQRVLESMGKHYSIEDAEGVIRRFHENGMSATINVMVGFPTETKRDFMDTVKFLTKTRRWIYQVSNVTTTQVALGSDLHLFPEKYGVTIHDDGSWHSPETGEEKDRQRRLRFLHLWMKFWKIPHQNIAPD